jgi:hypothetical protein
MLKFSDFLIFLSLMVAMPVSAQRAFRGGALLGGVTSQISGDRLQGFDQFGLSGGFFAEAPLSDYLSLELDILFVQKGSRKIPNHKAGDFDTYNLRLNYIEVPVMLKFDVKGFHVGAGAYGAILTSSRERINDFEIQGAPFKGPDAGFIGTVEYEFKEKWRLVGRYSNSVISVRDHTGQHPVAVMNYFNAGQYNSAIQLMICRAF